MRVIIKLGLLIFMTAVSTAFAAVKFVPPAGSPIAKGEHPRIFVTRADLPRLRAKIQTHYGTDFRAFVDHMDSLMEVPPGSGIFSEWNEIFGSARSFALLYLIDPQTILGRPGKYSRQQYGQKALEMALYIAKNLDDTWKETHNGAKNLSTAKGGLASLALQVVYDWTHDLATLEQRRAIVDRLITMWNNKYDSKKLKLENHYTANAHVYAGALCFYGDNDLGPSYTAKAQEMMDSFQDIFMIRQLAVAERLFEGSSDWIEGDSYSFDALVSLLMLAGAAESALGMKLIATNPWLKYSPYYIYYYTIPMPYQGEYYFSQQNTSTMLEVRGRPASAVMNMIAAKLYEDDPNLAGFASWFLHESPYGLDVDEFKYYEPHLFDFFYKFIFGSKHVPSKSPDEAGVPLSVQLGQMHAMRSDHSINDATLIQFFAFKYWYSNGHNETEMGAINIHRFGPLAISAANSKNAGKGIPRVRSGGKGMVLNNILGIAGDNRLSVEFESDGTDADTPEYFQDGRNNHIGTVEAREYRPGLYDYINYNYTRAYRDGNKTRLARRAVVYLRGPVNKEFVVVMDRLDSDREKYFILHTPADIEAVDGRWNSVGSGHWVTGTRILKVVNRIDKAHGQMYITSVFPQNITVHKFGGPGYEWVLADGTPLDYDASNFSEKAAFFLSSHTLQIRSFDNQFLTVMQIGDANTMEVNASVKRLSGSNWIGALIDEERLVIFSNQEKPIENFAYTIYSQKAVKHLITEMKPRYEYTVKRGNTVVARGTTGPNGTISFTDNPGGTATYMVELGAFTSTEESKDAALPKSIRLVNYPNPFNPRTTIYFSIPVFGATTLMIFNMRGQVVRTLVADTLQPGEYKVEWDGRDNKGRRVASGVYPCRLSVGELVAWNKLVMAK